MPLYRERWLTMLRVEQGVDRGPIETALIDRDSLRCGRVLNHDMDYCWRWNGYNFGLDLLITYNSVVCCIILNIKLGQQKYLYYFKYLTRSTKILYS